MTSQDSKKDSEKCCCYERLNKTTDIENTIINVSCTEENVYFATKNAIFQKEQEKISNRDSDYRRCTIEGSVKQMTYIKCDEDIVLIALVGKNVLMLKEKDWPGKFRNTEIQGALFINSTQDHEFLIIVDQKRITKYCFVQGQLQIWKDQVEHRMKPLSVAVGKSQIAILEKYKISKLDSNFRNVGDVKVPKDVKYLTAVKGADQFAYVSNGTTFYFGSDVVVKDEYAKFEDDPLQMVIIPPYAFALQQKAISVRATVAPIQEDLDLYYKVKGSCLAVLDNFNIILTQGKSIFVAKYTSVDKHIKYLTVNKRKWESAIELCRAFTQPWFKTNEKLSDLYKDFSDSMIRVSRYSEGLDLFQKSGKHPFELLRRFKSFATDSIKNEIEDDINKTEEALRNVLIAFRCNPDDLKEAPMVDSFGCDPDKVRDAMTKLIQIKQSNEKIPDDDSIIENCSQIANQARLDLIELESTRKSVRDVLFNCHNLTIERSNLFIFMQAYLTKIVQREKQSTCVKIYNTMILQCDAKIAPIQLEDFVKSNPPIFFNEAYKVLLELRQNKAIPILCELHKRHDEAVNFLIEQDEITTAIKYIKCSADWKEIGTKFFNMIIRKLMFDKEPAKDKPSEKGINMVKLSDKQFKRLQNNVPEIFFSQRLEVSDIDDIIRTLKEASFSEDGASDSKDVGSDLRELRLIFTYRFLEFAIYERKLVSQDVNRTLIKTFLELLKDHPNLMKKPVLIDNEKDEQIKSYRKGLLRILEANGRGNESIKDSIPEKFVEEQIAFYKSINDPLGALKFINAKDMKMDTVFYLLGKIYDKDDPKAREVYQKYFETICDNLQTEEGRNKQAEVEIPEFLNVCAERVDPVAVLKKFSDFNDVSKIYEFLKFSTTTRPNNSRLVTIQNALLKDLIKQKRQQLSYLKGGYVEVNPDTKCAICGKPIGDSVFYVLKSNVVTHSFCKPEEGLE